MIDFPSDRECIALDVGCASGYLTEYLASRLSGMAIGIDVTIHNLRRGKMRVRYEKSTARRNVGLICCDVDHLPFRKGSIDLVVCASLLEHVNDLNRVIKEIKNLMRENAILIAGYPIETSFFVAFLRIFLPTGLAIRDPRIMGKEEFERSPETHKQSFATIRSLLQKYFLTVKREKSFFTILPDTVSWCECTKMVMKSEPQLET